MLVITMTAGTGVVMWLGELITDRGVGNGMSVLIFTSIAARLPGEGWHDPGRATAAASSSWSSRSVLVIIAAVVFIEQAQRRIPVQYAKRMIGRRMYGGTSTYIRLKVSQAGVIPVIFASSLLYLPQLRPSVHRPEQPLAGSPPSGSGTPSRANPVQLELYRRSYFLMIIFFTYFYVSITFNPTEVADNMKKYGGFVPGIRPGQAHRRIPGLHPQPDHPSGGPLPRPHLRAAELLLHLAQCPAVPELPVRWYGRSGSWSVWAWRP